VAEPALHLALIEALRADREALNTRFVMRQRTGARIDEAEFQEHLRTTVNALVARVADVFPERTRAVVNALFDVSLDLFAAHLLGADGSAPRAAPSDDTKPAVPRKHPHVSAAWAEVLPQAVRLLARDPLRIAGSLSNAVDRIAAQTSARPAEWIEVMRDLSAQCESVSQWLDVGRVVAWRAGLVQYREAALQIARTLPRRLAAACLGVRGEPSEIESESWLDRLSADPWLAPAHCLATAPRTTPHLMRAVGGFRGFGGPCLRPPTVAARDGHLFVTDGEGRWQLLADVFGTLWQPIAMSPEAAAHADDVKIDARGRVTWAGAVRELGELAGSSSYACNGHTLAVTVPTSHLVFLVARSADES
jgi:hypothetical protein